MRLTIKQEKFCQEYLKCGNASEAYRKSYNAGKMATGTINTNAKTLLKNNPVAIRIEELRNRVEKKAFATFDQKRDLLWNLAIKCAQDDLENDKPKQAAAVVAALAELNKMDGDLATIKTEISGSLKVTHEEMLNQLK